MKLKAKDISFRYDTGSRQILNRVSLKIGSGERVGITAPSGFGKTTFCKILSGYEKPDSGQVMLDGKPLEEYKGRLPVQMIWQHPEQAVNPRFEGRRTNKSGASGKTGNQKGVDGSFSFGTLRRRTSAFLYRKGAGRGD